MSASFISGALHKLHVTRDTQVDTFLVEDRTGFSQKRPQFGNLPGRQGHFVAARLVVYARVCVTVPVETEIQRRRPCRAAKLVKAIVEPLPGLGLVRLSIGEVLVPVDGNVKAAF